MVDFNQPEEIIIFLASGEVVASQWSDLLVFFLLLFYMIRRENILLRGVISSPNTPSKLIKGKKN